MFIKIFTIIMLCNSISLLIGLIAINYIQYKKINKLWEKEYKKQIGEF